MSITDHEKKIKTEIERVKSLINGESSGWVIRDKSLLLYSNDSVRKMKKYGRVSGEKLEMVGVRTIADLNAITDDQVRELGFLNIGERQLTDFQQQASQATKGERPKDIDYRKETNPYLARYGSSWREVIDNTHFMRHFTCVTKMVDHMFEFSKKAFQGTTHEKDWMLYHDALSLMTA